MPVSDLLRSGHTLIERAVSELVFEQLDLEGFHFVD